MSKFKNMLMAMMLVAASLFSFVVPSIAFAQEEASATQGDVNPGALTTKMLQMQQKFNRTLINEMTSDLMNNEVIGWNSGGLVRVIFVVCFLIALVQALSNSNPTAMVTDMTKLAFWTWLVIALLGGPTYTKFSFLQVGGDYAAPANSLDLDIFNFVTYQADMMAKDMLDASGPKLLADASNKNKVLIENLLNSRRHCSSNPAIGQKCIQKFLRGANGDGTGIVNPDSIEKEGTSQEELDKKKSAFIPDFIVEWVFILGSYLSDLTLLAFYLLSWLIDAVRAAMNMFILIAFGIITGVSFFLMKFIFPFAVLPKYRGQVFRAMKVPLSTCLYGFATSLIVYVSGVGFVAMNKAAFTVIIEKVANGDGGDLLMMIYPLTLSVFTGMIIFALFQVFAIVKTPKLCRDLLDLSFDSFVDFAKEVVATGVKVAAIAATGGAAAAGGMIGGAAGSMGGMMSGAMSKAGGFISNIGSKFGIGGSALKSAATSGFTGAGSAATKPVGGMAGKGVNTSTVGMDAAREGAMGATSPQAAAQAAATDSIMPDKPIKEPNKEKPAKVSKSEESRNKMIRQGFSANASSGERNKALDAILGKKPEGIMSTMMTAGLAAGAGDTGMFQNLVKEKVIGGAKTASQFAQDATRSFSSEEKEQIREAKIAAGIDPDDMTDPANQTFMQQQIGKVKESSAYQSIQGATNKVRSTFDNLVENARSRYADNNLKPGSNRSNMIEKSSQSLTRAEMSQDQQAFVSNSVNTLSNKGSLSNQDMSQLMMLQNNYNMQDAESQIIKDALNRDARSRIKNIEDGKGTEEDFEALFRSNNSDAISRHTRNDIKKLVESNKEFGDYNRNQLDLNEKLRSEMDSLDLGSKDGANKFNEISQRVDSGMYNRNDFSSQFKGRIVNFSNDQDKKVVADSETTLSKIEKEKDESKREKMKESVRNSYSQNSRAFAGRQDLIEKINQMTKEKAQETGYEDAKEEMGQPLDDAKQRQLKEEYKNSSKNLTESIEVKLKEQQGDVVLKNKGQTYEFGKKEDGSLEDALFIKNNAALDDFSQIDAEFIESMKRKAKEQEKLINDIDSGENVSERAKARYLKAQQDLVFLNQIIEMYKKSVK